MTAKEFLYSLMGMLGENRHPRIVNLNVVIQMRLVVAISIHGLFLREMDTLERAESCIMETQKQFMLKRKAVEKMSPKDDINAVISHGLGSSKGKSKNEEKQKGGSGV